jgi:hypothetical protein
MDLKKRIREAINIASAENRSNTPDFILAEYLTDCLDAFDKATKARQIWYQVGEVIETNNYTPQQPTATYCTCTPSGLVYREGIPTCSTCGHRYRDTGTHEKTKENTTSEKVNNPSTKAWLSDRGGIVDDKEYYEPGDEIPGLGIVDKLPFGLPWVSTKDGLYRYGVISVAQTHLCDAVSGKILTPEELESRINNKDFDYGHRVQNSIVYGGGFQF